MRSSTASSDEVIASLTRSGYAERLLHWEGRPFGLNDYPMFRAIYDASPKRLLLKTCRQVGKSMTLASFSLSESVAIPHFKTFFIAPTKEQTQTFSTARIGKFIAFSPLIRDIFISPSAPNRVLARHFAHGSQIVFSYASDDADRCRGQSCDRLCFDDKAEVLTRTGWVSVKELGLDDEVADVNDRGVIEWSRPTEVFHKRHTGGMVRFSHTGIDLRVTEDHWMWAQPLKEYETFLFVRAKQLVERDFNFIQVHEDFAQEVISFNARHVSQEQVRDEAVHCFTVANHRPVMRGGPGQKAIITSQCIDEVQDMLLDVVRPVVVECLRASKYSYETYCGTPKTFENGIEAMWAGSSQCEWVIKCPSCGKSSILLSEKQCGRYGPVCLGCQAYLNPRLGNWVDMNRRPPDSDGIVTQTKGFHISRLMMPQNVPAAWPKGSTEWTNALIKWREVLSALDGPDAYPIATFRNEVLGVSDSQGRRLVTQNMLLEACDGPPICPKPTRENVKGVTKIAAGIDWSGGGTAITGSDGAVSIKSRTVLTIIGKMGIGRTRLLYYKMFPGTSPVEEFEEMAEALRYYDECTHYQMFIGADAGEGNMGTDLLRHRLQNPIRVVKFRYSGTSAGYISWNKKGKFYTVNRTQAIDSLMTALIRKEFQFPKEPDTIMAVPFKDILAEYEEIIGETGIGRKVWRHAPTQPDDFLHALNFARIALQIANKEVDLTASIESDDD